MKRDFASFDLPPAVAAAHRRTPRHLRRRAIPKNNYLAESPVTTGKRSRNRRGPGAPKGNANAVKPGAASQRAFLRYCSALIRETRALLELRALFMRQMKLERRIP